MATLQETVVLKVLEEPFDVIKLAASASLPRWLIDATTFFVARTTDELSIMCPLAIVPSAEQSGSKWRCVRVDGELAFDQIGVAASISQPLANAGLSIILVGTHDRDYVFVETQRLDAALDVYRHNGFTVKVT